MPSLPKLAAESYVPFANLSVEVFAIIAEHLEVNDIQSCRLSGRILHFLSSPYLCQTVTFAPHQEDLDRLEEISQQPLLSHNTHTLRYDTTILRKTDEERDGLNKLEFLDRYSNTADHQWVRTPRDRLLYNAEPVLQHEDIEALSKYVDEQNVILSNLERHLQHIMSIFPKLSTITICNSYWKKSVKFKYALRENSIARKWVRASQLLPLFKAIASTPACIIRRVNVQGHTTSKPYKLLDNCDFGDDWHTIGSIKYCLGSAFKTAHYTKENIPYIYGSALSLSPEHIVTTQEVFRNLTHLKIGLYTDVPLEADTTTVPKKYWADFPKILKSLTKVVDLSLDMKVRRSIDQQHIETYYHDDLRELFGDLQMPQLKHLELSQFRSCGWSVMRLLLYHPKLRELSLGYIIEIQTSHDAWLYSNGNMTWNADPQWVQCIEVMRALKLRRLRLQGIEGFGHNFSRFGSENENLTLSRIHDYILYGYGDNPLPTRIPVELNGLEWDTELW